MIRRFIDAVRVLFPGLFRNKHQCEKCFFSRKMSGGFLDGGTGSSHYLTCWQYAFRTKDNCCYGEVWPNYGVNKDEKCPHFKDKEQQE
jgi:hypothetical protein